MKLIDKDAVLAEIERRKQVALGWIETAPNDAIEAEFELCDDILSSLNTLEVKEVDLKDEASICDELVKYLGSYSSRDFAVAKHFFELGMAEKFIEDYTRNCSNEILIPLKDNKGYYTESYTPWLTPDQALRAVELAREEIYEWLENNIYMYNGECENDRTAIINDLKQAMKDE